MDDLFEVEFPEYRKVCRGSIYLNNRVVSGREYDCIFLIEGRKDMQALLDPFLKEKRTLVIRHEDFLKGELVNV